MNIVLDISTTSCSSFIIIFISSWVIPKFWKTFRKQRKVLFSCLASAALFPPEAIILESKSEAQGIKSDVLRGHRSFQRSSENIDPEEIVDGILRDKWDIRTINNESLSLLSRGLYTKTESSTLMSRSKNETWFPWRSTLTSNSLGYICLKYIRNSLSSKVINVWKHSFKVSCFIYLDLKK